MSIRLKDTANITAKSASSATSATKATQDSAGQQINTTYIKGLSVNGRTITYTKGDGSTGTITTQDTNTDTNTTYTLSKNGSTITLTGSDGKTTSVTDSNTTYSTGTTSTAGLTKLYTGVGTATDGTMTQAAMKTALDGKAASSHTHNYAGSSSAGGAANSANLLNITGGRVTSANSAVIVGPNTSMMLSTSSMTTGKPASDGYITEYRWDNNGGWSSQLFVPNNPKGVLQYRSMNAGTWDNWNTVYSTCNPQTTITGNAGTATTLQTARTINGTSFNGSANITTANWGTARNITIGNTAKSVNGSANVSWSLSEIGAAPAGYGLGTTCQDKSNQDCNNILVTGFYMGSNMTNKPSGCTQGWIYLLVMRHNDSWVRQVAYDFGTASQVYTRVKQNGSWTAWVATDTNTWRGVQDNLTSTATDQSLSANQGKVLKGLIDGKAASNHTHSYLPLSGGTLTSSIKFSGGGYNSHAIRMEAGDANGAFIGIGAGGLTVIGSGESTDAVRTALTNGADETMIVASDQTIRFLTGVQNGYSSAKEVSINTSGVINAPQGMTGNASTATKLQTVRTINGTNFDGSANITTANWGTARTITVGNTGKSVNGSGNVSWSLGEIGALPLAGGTLSGRLTANGRISAPTAGSNWISGMTVANATIGISTQQSENAYHPVLAVKTSGNHVANIGGIGNDFGFYGFKSGRTENGTDWSFKFNVGTGAVSSTGNITAPTFVGALSGNASTATKATQDSAGQQINKTYIKGLSVNGKTITYTKGDGTTGTITTQDTNTTYSVGTASALGLTKLYTGTGTATDGTMTQAALKTALDGKAASSHTHNYAGSSSAGGAANSANTLATARTINGTSFNGSANITTANWGTARNIYIADSDGTNTGSAVSVNGSGNATLKLPSTIKAALSGNASTATKLATARTIKVGNTGKTFDGSGGITFTLADIGIVSGTSAPNNDDGRPNGTVYFKYA